MKITIPALSDYHVHLRQHEGACLLPRVAAYTDSQCGRALLMPNIQPAITDLAMLLSYRNAVQSVLTSCEPLFSFKLTPRITPALVREMATGCPQLVAGKLYPEGVTTHSGDGIQEAVLRSPTKHPWFGDILREMELQNLVLCLHGEMPNRDPLVREPVFLDTLSWILAQFPRLRVVLEHITHSRQVDYILRCRPEARIAATITVHHLFLHIGHLFGCTEEWGFLNDCKLHPHNFCWPIPKRPEDRDVLQDAALSGNPRFFLGSDSAPHPVTEKETSCGCAGVFTAPVLAQCLVWFFTARDGLSKLANFSSRFGDRFYERTPISRTLTLEDDPERIPDRINGLVPFMAGRKLPWRIIPS